MNIDFEAQKNLLGKSKPAVTRVKKVPYQRCFKSKKNQKTKFRQTTYFSRQNALVFQARQVKNLKRMCFIPHWMKRVCVSGNHRKKIDKTRMWSKCVFLCFFVFWICYRGAKRVCVFFLGVEIRNPHMCFCPRKPERTCVLHEHGKNNTTAYVFYRNIYGPQL